MPANQRDQHPQQAQDDLILIERVCLSLCTRFTIFDPGPFLRLVFQAAQKQDVQDQADQENDRRDQEKSRIAPILRDQPHGNAAGAHGDVDGGKEGRIGSSAPVRRGQPDQDGTQDRECQSRSGAIKHGSQQQRGLASGKGQQQSRGDGQQQARDEHDIGAMFIRQATGHEARQNQGTRIDGEKQPDMIEAAVLAIQGQEGHDRTH